MSDVNTATNSSFKIDLKDKLKAGLLHLLCSFVLASVLAIIVFFVWYPAPMPKATGITHVFVMMLAIDVIIGPILTFLVYKKGKKTLKFDIFVIVLLQLCAMVYGMYFVAQGRPAWIVQVNDRFVMVSPSMALDKNNDSIANRFELQNWGKPKFYSVKFSDDVRLNNIQTEEDTYGKGIVYQPEGYSMYNSTEVLKNARPLIELNKYNTENQVKKYISKYQSVSAWLPLRGMDFANDLVVLLDSQGQIIAVVDLNPWKPSVES